MIALSCMALGLVGDPLAFFEKGSPHAGIAAHAQTAPITPLSGDDVSWLFPAPTSLDDLISMADLKTNGKPIWSDDAFRQFLTIATGPAGHVEGTDQGIVLPDEIRSKRAWYIAAVRFDPSAPGFTPEIRDQFGQELQIRLVVQPVTRNADGTLQVHDIAAHLVFEFNTGNDKPPAEKGCFPRPRPDLGLSKQIAQELVEVRSKTGEDKTSGKPLGVHPGLANPATASRVRQAMKELLERHLSSQHLGSMTITAVRQDAVKRWIFLSMINLKVHPHIYPLPSRIGFIPMPAAALDGHQYAQMFSAAAELQNAVVPIPYPNNDYRDERGHFAITCQNGANPMAGPPLERRIGYATADILNKRPLTDPDPLHHHEPERNVMQAVLDTIADPDRSHVHSTDCVSCHNETPLLQERLKITTIPGIDPCVLPGENTYNMRAFGWAPQHNEFQNTDTVRPTVSRRAANETTKVADYINRELLGTSVAAPIPDQVAVEAKKCDS